MQPDSNYIEELLRVQQIANPDVKSRVMSTLAGTSDLGLPGKAGSEYKPQTVYELMNKYSPPALIAKGIGKAYEASPDAVKKNVGEFAEDIGKAYQTARNMSPVIRGAEAVLTAAPKMPEGYIGGSPMDNPMANMETGPGMLDAFTAFHGSPYKFKLFDAAHIGSGEGTQAFGHGIYFAETPGVARSYVKAPEGSGVLVDKKTGSVIDIQSLPLSAAAKSELNGLIATGSSVPMVIRSARNNAKLSRWWDADDVRAGLAPTRQEWADEMDNLADLLEKSDYSHSFTPGQGAFYKVDIPDEFAPQLLDWDAPLSEQSPYVKSKLSNVDLGRDVSNYTAKQNLAGQWIVYKKLGENRAVPLSGVYIADNADEAILKRLKATEKHATRGEAIYKHLASKLGSQETASEYLRQLGIPGHKYFDAGSRTAGEGTRNFVIYPGNESQVKILERNNIPFDSPNFSHGGHVSLNDMYAKYAEGGRVMADELARVQSIINAVP